MPFTVKTKPEILPVTVEAAMAHNIDVNKNNVDIYSGFIKAFTDKGQGITGRQFVKTGFTLDLDVFPDSKIDLMPNLQAVSEVRYIDANDEAQTLHVDEYTIKKTTIIGQISPVESWPVGATDIEVDFESGYPVDSETKSASTPDSIKIWMMVKIAGIFEQRSDFVLSKGGRFGIATMPRDFIDSMLDEYIVPGRGSGI